MRIKLLDGVTATNGVPTAGDKTVGHPLTGLGFTGAGHSPPVDRVASVSLASTAGSGTMTVTVRLWVWVEAMSDWAPLGADATAANRGVLNDGNAIDEVDSDLLRHTELVTGLRNYSDVYAQVTAIGGTATAVDLWLHAR
jgi:hypothetical protein